MEGYKAFLNKLSNLEILEQKFLMERLFNIRVLVFDINAIDDKILIKIYDGLTYYQFLFSFDDNKDYFDIRIRDRMVLCNIYINNIPISEKLVEENSFYKFIKILRDDDISYFEFL